MSANVISLVMPTISWEEPFASCAHAALRSLGPGEAALIMYTALHRHLPPGWSMRVQVC